MKDMMSKQMAMKDELPPFTCEGGWKLILLILPFGSNPLPIMLAVSVWCMNPACGNPGAFVNVVSAVACFDTYVDGVRANLLAGGDNCSRSCLIGALLAAQGGMGSIPKEWREKTTEFQEYELLVDKVLTLN